MSRSLLNITRESVINEQQVLPLFELYKASMMRTWSPFSVVFIEAYDTEMIEQDGELISSYVQSAIRQTDILFKLKNVYGWGIILFQSKEKEALAFIDRLFTGVKNDLAKEIGATKQSLIATIAEIGNDEVSFFELLTEGRDALSQLRKLGPWQIDYIRAFNKKKREVVKVSVLETDELVQEIITLALERIEPENFELNIKQFHDGEEFIQSDWYHSYHPHIVIMNDVLPRKNGFDVLQTVRKLPNDKRFTVLMMTKRKSEDEMSMAYENGVDAYLVKPFGIRLFEAQMKRMIERLWR